jgi:hypothetical protein
MLFPATPTKKVLTAKLAWCLLWPEGLFAACMFARRLAVASCTDLELVQQLGMRRRIGRCLLQEELRAAQKKAVLLDQQARVLEQQYNAASSSSLQTSDLLRDLQKRLDNTRRQLEGAGTLQALMRMWSAGACTHNAVQGSALMMPMYQWPRCLACTCVQR